MAVHLRLTSIWSCTRDKPEDHTNTAASLELPRGVRIKTYKPQRVIRCVKCSVRSLYLIIDDAVLFRRGKKETVTEKSIKSAADRRRMHVSDCIAQTKKKRGEGKREL